MRILLINKYLYPKGGDAISTLSTGDLLSRKGHEVSYWGMEHPSNPYYPLSEYFVSYVDYSSSMSFAEKLHSSLNILYSREARIKIEEVVKKKKPEMVHLNNFAHQVSPSILDVLRKYHIPSVMTMRDYKLVCASYSMLVNGEPCERCKGGKYYHCLKERCTKGSLMKSFMNTLEMYLHHKLLHIYDRISTFIAPSQFMQRKVREMGFNGEIVHLPNFTFLDNVRPSHSCEERSIVYVGRISHEKGLLTLVNAMKGLKCTLKLIGEGPLTANLSDRVQKECIDNIRFLGYKSGSDLQKEIKNSMFLILPSEWYENNPRAVIEAFALGKPALGARIGGIPELIKDWETGLTFEPGNAHDLRDKIDILLQNVDLLPDMGRRARHLVEHDLNPELHYQRLIDIYERAMKKEAGN